MVTHSLVLRQGRCDKCGRRVVRGAAVPRVGRARGAISYCAYDGSVYNKEGRPLGYVFSGAFHPYPHFPNEKTARQCPRCGAREVTNGIYTNLAPYSGLCVACITGRTDN